ncbi:MAG: family 78 glycoside hydrolase catalytic domain [Lachnospiraceae bacterium]|nr:family 78 glycoside hydrolase catalytic domain [Lachnospiraceae bacterium]
MDRKAKTDWKRIRDIRTLLIGVICVILCLAGVTGCRSNAQEQQYEEQFESKEEPETGQQEAEPGASFAVSRLKTNWIENPVGVDTSTPCFSWEMISDVQEVTQKAYRINVRSAETEEKTLLWDSGTVFDSRTTGIRYEGEPLQSHTVYEWEVAVWNQEGQMSEKVSSSFQTAYVEEQPFAGAAMICMQGEENVYDEGQAVFVRDFEVKCGELKRATLYASALGIYDAYINGQRVGADELKPGWSNYEKSLYYNTYDITELLSGSAGGNASPAEESRSRIAVMLGTGWWCGRVAFGTYDYHKPALVCTIRLEYRDGRVEEICTDESWTYVKDTAVICADLFNGEVFDARKPTTGELSDASLTPELSGEKAVVVSTDFAGEYHSFYGNQVQHLKAYDREPVSVVVYDSVSENGTTYGEISVKRESGYDGQLRLLRGETAIFDLGQNMAGVPYVSYESAEGAEVTIDFAEMLNDSGSEERGNDGPKGSLYTANYRSAESKLTLVSDGEGVQEYQPVFTYYGFRYLSVTASEDITIRRIEGRCIGNSSEECGWLSTDNEMLNQLYENTKWTQRNNFLLVATDCPQRDERLGWMGDLQVFAKTSLYNQDLMSFYRKWSKDCMESQTEEGAYTDTVPRTIITGSGNAGWGDAGISVPYDLYHMYGDETLLESSYASMQRYMEYLASVSDFAVQGGRIGPLTTYGDWLGFEDSDKELISTLCYAKDAGQMAEIADILGDKKSVRTYRKLFGQITDYFHEKYMEDGHIRAGYRTQTALVLAMAYGLLDGKEDQAACEDLLIKLEESGGTLTTGFLGTPLILKELSEHGELDAAYRLLLKTENPSWLYSILQGATTIWERYDSYTIENGFADAAMNSFDHFNNGSVAAWMYEDLLGIRITCEAEKEERIVLKPGIVADVDAALIRHAEGGYHSAYGEISASWEITEKGITYQVRLPANCRAALYLPVKGSDEPDSYQKSSIGSGTYTYFYKIDTNEWVPD